MKIVVDYTDGSCSIGMLYNYYETYKLWTEATGQLFNGIKLEDFTADDFVDFVMWKDVPTYRLLMLVNETDDEAKIRLNTNDLDGSLPARKTLEENIPSDEEFRAAWTDDNPGDTVDVDMPRARIIQDNRIRVARDAKWPDFDSRYLAAQRDSSDLTTLDTERLTLKDIPNNAKINIDAAADVAALKAAWPVSLV